MTIQHILTEARQRLKAAGCDTPKLDAEVLLAHVLGRDRTWLISHSKDDLTELERDSFHQLINQRVQREPVAYLVGHKAFYGLDFGVTPATLIPRPETELLVEVAIRLASAALTPLASLEESLEEAVAVEASAVARNLKSPASQKSKYSIVDVGTGSGCIAVTLAKMLPQANLTAIDLSTEALAVARQNAEKIGVADQIKFVPGDLLASLDEPVDMIVSNPPYVNPVDLEAPFTTPEVYHYEPRLALDGGEAGLVVIEQLLVQAIDRLKADGMLLVEIGATQGNVVKSLAQAKFPTAAVEIKPDLAGLDRLLVVKNRVD